MVVTLWVSWQLDGGAAALNEAGRMRMQSYRMALSITKEDKASLTEQIWEFDSSFAKAIPNGRCSCPGIPPFVQVSQRWKVVG
jgi:nitrate/nitrite-specific signal transduction histidine kinase